MNSNGALNQDMWMLCTPEMQDYWRDVIQGTSAPTIETTEVDWGNYDGLYPYSYGVGAFHGSARRERVGRVTSVAQQRTG